MTIRSQSASSMRHESGLLAEAWYAAATSAQVGQDKPLGRTILGEMLVMWRTADGSVACLRDHCMHRQALLSEGDVVNGHIGCPYHGWTYDRSGQCVDIPSEGAESTACARYKTISFPTREQGGLVWVWMGASPQTGEPLSMPHVGEAGWGTYYMETLFDNSVLNLVENFMDVPHTVFVHRGWFRSPARRKVPATVERTRDSVLVTYDEPGDSIGFWGRILNPRSEPMTHTDRFYLPNNTQVDYMFGGTNALVITSTCTPISHMQTRVFTLISYRLGLLNPAARLLLPWYTRRVITQDVQIMEIQGRSHRHLENETCFHNTDADLVHTEIEALRRWAAGGGNEPRPEPRTQRMEFWL